MRKGRRVSGHLYKRDGLWWVRWQSGGRRFYRSTGETSKPRARTKADEILAPFRALEERDTLAAIKDRLAGAEVSAQEAVDIVNRIPLREVWKRHPYDHSQPKRANGTIRELSPMNVAQNKRDWEQFIDWMEEEHGDLEAMQDVTPDIAQEYSDHLFKKKRVTAGRHNKLITTCNVMYRLAGVPSPFAGVTKYQTPEHEHREPFDVQQVESLLTSAQGEMRGLLAVLYFTGLRAGDAVQLRHENRKDGKIVVKTAKSGATVDILEHPMLTTIIGDVCGDSKRGPLFPELAEHYRRDRVGLIHRFNRLMKSALGDDFSRTEKRTGRGVKAIARFGMHSFRHSLATHCARAGVPIGIVQKWLGHASETVTRIYQHYSTEDQKQIVAAIPRLALPGMEDQGDIIEAEAVVETKPVDLHAVRELVDGLTVKNVVAVRKKLLAMLPA